MARCKHCDILLTAKEAAGRACPICGGVLNEAAVEEPVTAAIVSKSPDLRGGSFEPRPSTSTGGGSRVGGCLICGEAQPTEPRFLKIYTIELQYRQRTTRWIDVRCNCCRSCERKIKWFQRMRSVQVFFVAAIFVLTLAAYIACLPLLQDIGAPGWLMGLGFVVCAIVAGLLFHAVVKGFSRGLISEYGIERFRSIGIGWDAGPNSGLIVTDYPTGTFIDLT